MSGAATILASTSPAWILVGLIGALWAGLTAAVAPPRPGSLPRIVLGAVVGAALGQVVGVATGSDMLPIGDVHALAASAGALAASAIVRRFCP